jgi:ADP-ribose 1''-phosphate phosphatase
MSEKYNVSCWKVARTVQKSKSPYHSNKGGSLVNLTKKKPTPYDSSCFKICSHARAIVIDFQTAERHVITLAIKGSKLASENFLQPSLHFQKSSDQTPTHLIQFRQHYPVVLLSKSTLSRHVFRTRTSTALSLSHHSGDIFAAPDNTVLIHACNTQSAWGSGIAVAFKKNYPNAFQAYNAHCLLKSRAQTGTCFLIAPCEKETAPTHWVACLFTSAKYGRQKDVPEEILKNTRLVVEDLLRHITIVEGNGEVGSLRMCKVNSGRFGVEWERTESILRKIVVKERSRNTVEIWDREA